MWKALSQLILAVIAASGINLAHAQSAKPDPIKLSWLAEPDSEVVTKIARQVLEQRLGYEVQLVNASLGLQYEALAGGRTDAMLMAWLPITQSAYWEKHQGNLEDLGTIYSGKIGWVIPDYIPRDQVQSIRDLAKPGVAAKFKSSVTGIDPGAGVMQASSEVIKKYSLDGYRLLPSSAAGMTAALNRAEKRKEWIIVTGWTPHTMFSRWNLRYLDDPEGVMGGVEGVHLLARKGFSQSHPRAAAFFRQYKIPVDELEAVMAKAQETKDFDGAVAEYMSTHSTRVDEWIKGTSDQPLLAQ